MDRPILNIRYSQDFGLKIERSEYVRYGKAATADWLFRVRCVIRHPTGRFVYEAERICFPCNEIKKFSTDLKKIQNGSLDRATLSAPGEMFTFALLLQAGKLKATITIREFQPQNELTVLTAGFKVDYDLFVNKLSHDVSAFARDLKGAELLG